jgi:MFS family permease
MLATACLFLISGRIYQLYSTNSVYVISLVIFEAGSALCGAAPTSVAFIIGRAITGLASAGIFTGEMMIILPHIPFANVLFTHPSSAWLLVLQVCLALLLVALSRAKCKTMRYLARELTDFF